MQFLYADGTSYTDDPNRNSLVVRFTLGSHHALFMGDAPGGPRSAPTQEQPVGVEQLVWPVSGHGDIESSLGEPRHPGYRQFPQNAAKYLFSFQSSALRPSRYPEEVPRPT
jgi:hypothetical protein